MELRSDAIIGGILFLVFLGIIGPNDTNHGTGERGGWMETEQR